MIRSASFLTLAMTVGLALPVGAVQVDPGTHFLGGSHRAATDSEFFEFFNLRQESATLLTDGREHFLYRPGGDFGPMALISLLVDDGVVVATTLSVHRAFLDHRVNGVFARDLVGSYIAAAPHAADGGDANALATLVKEGAADVASAMLGNESPTTRALAAVKNRAADVALEWGATTVRLQNEPGLDEVESLTIAVLPAGGVPSARQQVDSEDPREVVEAVFEAARTQDPSLLRDLCDPLEDSDGDTATLCTLTTQSAEWPDFVAAFERGRISGAVSVEDAITPMMASVPIVFGAGGQTTETMILVNRDGRWYLSSF